MNLLWCLVLLSIGLVEGKYVFFNVPKEYVENILKVAGECVESTGIESDAVQKVIHANLEDNEVFKKFLHCFCSRTGYIDSNGHFVVDKITKLIGDYKDKAKFVDAINLCNKSEGDNIYDTTYKTLVCFRDNSPLYFTI